MMLGFFAVAVNRGAGGRGLGWSFFRGCGGSGEEFPMGLGMMPRC
jgi:hypothetical protein